MSVQHEHSSETVTQGVRVRVEPEYLPDQSDPDEGLWVHAYHVTITNAQGEEEHVRGPGVVGFQPLLEPGQSFRYSSGCPLNTSVGSMHGEYQMITKAGARFDALVSPFTLAEPFAFN